MWIISKQSGGWAIKLIKSIEQSIQAKTFISMLGVLVGCCVVIYSMVMIFLPKNYKSKLEHQATADFYTLVESLEKNGWENSSEELLRFSTQNNASVKINSETDDNIFSVNFSDTENRQPSTASLGCWASFVQNGQNFQIFATVSLTAVSQSFDVLIRLIPLIAVMILVISLISALICSRYFSKPLVHICGVARRMASLDMTWKCEVKQKDEIGILASSLNTLSERLSNALVSLQTANEQLKQDIEKEKKQEQQRIDFFTAVSHELKTPVAIIKGELEGMIYEVGEYKNRDVYLRHCLNTVNNMEELIKEILLAARMGGSDFSLARSDLNLSQMLQKSCQKFKGAMEDHGIKLCQKILPDFHYHGDRRLMDKVFTTVIGNAVSYSPNNAVITVSLQKNVFYVENSGAFIHQEDLINIYTPFYRVEKSRSRNSGGTGLGLYITKMILDRHDVAHNIENTEHGVRFTAIF